MYSVKPIPNFLQIFNALTGAPHFSVHVNNKKLHTYFINGNTLTVNYDGGIVEIWDLTKRQKIR